MRILPTVIAGLSLSFSASARPLRPNEAVSLGARYEPPPSALAHALEEIGNAAVSNWTTTQLGQLGVLMENLELYLIGEILDKYSESDFAAAGYDSWVRGRLLQLQEQDQAHHDYLSALLQEFNATVPLPCKYPLEDTILSTGVKNSLIFLCGIEEVVECAYLGFEPYVNLPAENRDIAQFASSEARHQSWILASVLREEPWSGPLDTAVTPDQMNAFLPFFFGSCPSNIEFPKVTWPPVSIVGPIPGPEYDGPPGLPVQLNYSGVLDKQAGETWVNVQSGLGIQVIPIGYNGTITVPADFQGFSFGMVVSTNKTTYTPEEIVAGPVTFHNGFNSSVPNPGLEFVMPD